MKTEALPQSFRGRTYCHCQIAPGPKESLMVSLVVTAKAFAVAVTRTLETEAPTWRLALPLTGPDEKGIPTDSVSLSAVVHVSLLPRLETRVVP